MACKYGSHDFPSDFGFSGSSGKISVKTHMRNAARGGRANDSTPSDGEKPLNPTGWDSTPSTKDSPATGPHSGNNFTNDAKGGRIHRAKGGAASAPVPKSTMPSKSAARLAKGGPAVGDVGIGDDMGATSGALSQVAPSKPPAIRGMAPRGRSASHAGIGKGVPTFAAKPKIGQ